MSSSSVMPTLLKCDIAHRQGVKLPDCWVTPRMCDTSHMSKFDIDAFRTRLQSLMDEHKIKRKPLAKAAGLGETSIRDIFDSSRNDVRIGTLVRLADYFQMSVDELIEEPEMRLAGRVGAGGQVLFEAEDSHSGPTVPKPPGASAAVMALEVVGTSMLPKYEDGDIVYVRRDVDGIPRSAIGEYCAVRTAEGGTYLKILAKGSEPGRFTLRSLNAPDMENEEVVWAAPVLWVRQRPARAI
ncbi:Peptidase S24-like [Novosphingobium aromaticivorans]|nr:Peptidase S24-like [Novosphingobium aromaticivorans]